MSSLLYPIMQTVDEEYLNIDGTIGGTNQHDIFENAEK